MAAESSTTRRTRLGASRLGLTIMAGGALLLTVVGAFFGYQAYVDVRYDDVIVTTALTLPTEQELFIPLSVAEAAIDPTTTSTSSDDGFSLASLYPGTEIAPQFWADPFWAEDVDDASITAGFLPPSEVALPAAGLGPPTLVRIPIIGLESGTIVLSVMEFGDGFKYAAPPFKVGIIPGTTNPGEIGNTWLFGHLESPIRGEGSVFRDLPRVHDFLRQGQRVYVIVDSKDGSFLYQATEFRIMPKEDVYLWSSDGRTVTLVASWPRFKYDERVVVTAELVGVRLNNATAVS